MMFAIITTLCLAYSITAVPVARLLGCGIPDSQFPVKNHQFCCIHFKMNCNYDSVEYILAPQNESVASAEHIRSDGSPSGKQDYGNTKIEHNVIRVRTLGEGCRSNNVRCAVGLECRRGICLRSRSLAHLQRLVKAGEKIEREELAQLNDNLETAINRGNTDAFAPKGITLHGQSIDISGNDGTKSKDYGPDFENSAKQPSLRYRNEDKAASGIEEDEVTANVADYLGSKGIEIDDEDWHNVRKLITGTIDERLERDDEVQKADDLIEARYGAGCSDGSKPCNVLKREPIIDLCPAPP